MQSIIINCQSSRRTDGGGISQNIWQNSRDLFSCLPIDLSNTPGKGINQKLTLSPNVKLYLHEDIIAKIGVPISSKAKNDSDFLIYRNESNTLNDLSRYYVINSEGLSVSNNQIPALMRHFITTSDAKKGIEELLSENLQVEISTNVASPTHMYNNKMTSTLLSFTKEAKLGQLCTIEPRNHIKLPCTANTFTSIEITIRAHTGRDVPVHFTRPVIVTLQFHNRFYTLGQ